MKEVALEPGVPAVIYGVCFTKGQFIFYSMQLAALTGKNCFCLGQAEQKDVEELARNPECIIVINCIPSEGAAAAAYSRLHALKNPILFFSEQLFTRAFIKRFMSDGRVSFFAAPHTEEEYGQCRSVLASGESYFSHAVLDALKCRSEKEELSEREGQVFECLKRLMSGREISDVLGISLGSVATYRFRIYAKLHISSIFDLSYKYDSNCNV